MDDPKPVVLVAGVVALLSFGVLIGVDTFGGAILRLAIIGVSVAVGFMLGELESAIQAGVFAGIAVAAYDLVVFGALVIASSVFCLSILAIVYHLLIDSYGNTHKHTQRAIPIEIVNDRKRNRMRKRRRRNSRRDNQ